MGWIKNIIIGLLSIVIGSTAIFIVMNNSDGESLLAMNITDNDAQFYVRLNNSFVLGGVEHSRLLEYNVTELENETIVEELILESQNNITYIEGETNFTAIRLQSYDNMLIKETYFYDGNNTDIQLFPIFHKIEIFNGTNKTYRYMVTDLDYSGPTLYDLNHLIMVGKNMSVEWLNEYPVYQELNSNGTLILDFNITEDYDELFIRLFDPITALTITEPLTNRSYLGYRNRIVFTFTNTTAVDKCWYTIDGGITNNTLLDIECSTKIFTRIWNEGTNFNLTLYVNQSDGTINSTTRNILVNTVFSSIFGTQGSSCQIRTMSSYGDELYMGCSSCLTCYFFKYNITNKTITNYNTAGGFINSQYLSKIIPYKDGFFLIGSYGYFNYYNITNNTFINLTSNLTYMFGSISTNSNLATLDNDSDRLFFYYANTGKYMLYEYNISNNNIINLTTYLPTIHATIPFIYTLEYDSNRKLLWMAAYSDNTNGKKALGYFNLTNNYSYTNMNSSFIAIDPSGTTVSAQGLKIDGDILYYLHSSTNYKLIKYNISSNISNVLGISTGTNYYSFDNIISLSSSPITSFLINNNNLYGDFSNKGFFFYNSSSNLSYMGLTNSNGDFGRTNLANSYIYSSTYNSLTDTIWFGYGSGSFGYFGNSNLYNINNTLTSSLLDNNSYTSSVDPLRISILDYSPISDCWYNINDGVNVSFKQYGCNVTTAINTFQYKFPVEIGQTYNFSLFTNNSNNNLSSLRFENITIRNMNNMRLSIPYNWYSVAWNEIEIDSMGNIIYVGNSGSIGMLKYSTKEFIDLSQNDELNILQADNVKSVLYDSYKNLTWFGQTGGKITYLNYSDMKIYNFTKLVLTTETLNSMTIDENNNDMLYISCSSGKLFKVNLTSKVIDDLSATDTGNWFGSSNINKVVWVNETTGSYIYIGVGNAGNAFGYYNVSSNVSTKLTAPGGILNNIYYDRTYNLLWLAEGNGYFGYYNITSKVTTDLSGTDVNGWQKVAASYFFVRKDNEVLLSGLTAAPYSIGVYKIDENKTYPSNMYYLTLNGYINKIKYNTLDNNFYYIGSNAEERFGMIENITPLLSPIILNPSINSSYYSLNAPITVQYNGKKVDRCWYSINNGANISFLCNNVIPINITPTRIIGINNLTIYGNDTSGNVASFSKSFKSVNYTMINSATGANPNYLLYNNTLNSLYFFGPSGLFRRINLTTLAVTDLSTVDTGNWIASSAILSACQSVDGMIYLAIDGGKFGYYNYSNNTATNLSVYVSSILGAANAYSYIQCSPTGEIYISSRLGAIAKYYPNNNTVENISVTSSLVSNLMPISLMGNYLAFGNAQNATVNEVYGFINLTDNSIVYLNLNQTFKPNKGTGTSKIFYNIVNNGLDTFYFGGVSEILAYNITDGTYTSMILNNSQSGTLSYSFYVQPYGGMSYNPSLNRIYYNTNAGGSYNFINLTSKKTYSLYYAYYPDETLAYAVNYGMLSANGFVYTSSNGNKIFSINETQLIEDYDIIIPDNSCTYSGSGTWYIQISDNCVIGTQTIDSPCNVNGSNGILLVNGTVLCKNISYTPTAFNGNFTVGILTGKTFGAYK